MSTQTSSTHNKQLIQNSTARSLVPTLRRNELSHLVWYSKKKGLLTLKARQLTWDPQTNDALKLLINLDTLVDKQVATNTAKGTELLLIKTIDNPNGYIFSFDGGNIILTPRWE
jgi:hypothetical protein